MRKLLVLLLLAPCALLAQVPDYVPTDGLVAWYPMNGNALDESGNGYDCQSIGATLTEDRFGAPYSAYEFDGQGSHLQGASLPFSDLSISLWFKAEAGVFETHSGGTPPTGAQLIGQGTTHNPCRYCDWAIGISDWFDGVDNLAWEKANSSSCQVQQTATNWEPELEEWTHLVAVSEGADVSFYINNDWVSTIPFDQPFQQGGSILSIGSRYVENCNGGGSCTGPDNAWSGSIDDVAVWNRILTPAEITSLYQGQAETPMMGCTDSTACNYDPAATEDEGSCLYPITILNVGDTVVTNEPLILESSGTQCSWSIGAETCSTLVTESGWYTVTQLDATSEGLRINPGQQVSLGGEDDFNFGTGDFSIALWFRSSDSITDYSTQLDPNGQFQILSKTPPPPFPYNNYYYDIQAGISQHSAYGTTYQTGPGTKFHWNSEPHPGSFNAYTDQVVCDGSWHHLTAVKEGTTLKMAIDGSFVHSAQDRTPNPGQTADNSGPLYLGVTDSVYAPMPYFIGQVQIFNEALTETDLESVMTDPIDPSASGLLGAWEFRGTNAGPSDLSGGGNHAELSGASLAYSEAGCSSSDSVYVHFIVTGCTDSTACNYVATAEINDASCVFPPSVDLGPDTITCEDIITLDAGEGFASYLWSTGETTQSIEAYLSGEYSVTVEGAANSMNAFAMEFDGEDDLIQTGIAASELIGLEALTIATRFKWMGDDPDDGPQEQGILSNAKSGNSQLDFGIDYGWPGGDQRMHLAWADESTLDSNAMQYSLLDAIAIQPDVWYDVVVTLSSDTVKWYLDGVLVEQDAVVFAELGQESNAVPNLRIGKANEIYDTHFGGVLDDLQLYTRALTAEEAQGLYACGVAHDSTGLIGHWSFEEGVGSITLDDSPAGNNGDIVGAQFTSDTPDSACPGCFASDTLEVSLHHGGCFCGEGTEWDEESQQCLAVDNGPTPSCGEGTVWDPVAEECIVAIPTDTDFDGCVTAGDVLNLLATFGTCPPISEWPDTPSDTTGTSWSCGDPLHYQGYDYTTVQIGDQCWFAENLKAEAYSNGDAVSSLLSDSDWGIASFGATVAYGESTSYCESFSPNLDACDETLSIEEYGRLYNWHAASDPRNLCPSGWHVPTDTEWSNLQDHIILQSLSGQIGLALKAISGWDSGNGTDAFGFHALPSGNRGSNGGFYGAGQGGGWWSSTANGNNAWRYWLSADSEGINRNDNWQVDGFSIRCLKD